MVNWQLSKQGICWPLSHDGTAGSDGNSSRSRVFLEVFRWPVVSFKLIPDSRLCFHSCGYGFVDFFAMVWIPLSEVNLKCINGSFVLSSGLSGSLLLYRTRNQKAKCIPCRGCVLKAEKFTQQIWWYNFKILLFHILFAFAFRERLSEKNVHGITPTENMRIINTLFLTLKLSNLFLLLSLSTCKHTSMAFRAIWRTVNFKPSAIGHSVLLRALSPTTFL